MEVSVKYLFWHSEFKHKVVQPVERPVLYRQLTPAPLHDAFHVLKAQTSPRSFRAVPAPEESLHFILAEPTAHIPYLKADLPLCLLQKAADWLLYTCDAADDS